ncbi:hypothetical protein PG994_010858 [Apiospora phragmitis]|uniref:Uncharacterized protein n=1 Tax=Apiospora phragmitis TaxID=2905665 RepID=A0ABR1TTU3_9PEZI
MRIPFLQACQLSSLVHKNENPGAQADAHADKQEDKGAKRGALAAHPCPRRKLESPSIEIDLICLVEMIMQRLINEGVIERVTSLMIEAVGPIDMAHTE